MNDKYKKILPFLENNIDLINSNQFEKLYAILPNVEFGGILTELFLKAGINPLQYMDLIPPYFYLNQKYLLLIFLIQLLQLGVKLFLMRI